MMTIRAEIIPGSSPAWYILAIAPNHERIALRHLARRGFGCYLPEFVEPAVRNGRRIMRTSLIFPGYLFVFVWRFDHQWRRIISCPGVLHPLCRGAEPAPIADDVIDQIQALESRSRHHAIIRRPRRKREPRGPVTLTISTRQYLDAIDGESRNRLLLNALGLPSQADASGHGQWPELAERTAIVNAASAMAAH